MIRANELRLGNWVLLDWENVYKKVNVNVLAYISRSEKLNKEHPFKPIQLTEEILLKIEGVEKHINIPNRYVFKEGNYHFIIEDGYWEQPSLDIMKNGMYIICVEHLHELQNTMFSLLKEELKIEL